MQQNRTALLALAGLLCSVAAWGQSTQGVISGRLLNSVTGLPIAGANVKFTSNTSTPNGFSISDSKGYYALPLLAPGRYRLRAEAMTYQSQEVQEVELAVASRLDFSFRLRPLSDVWESGQYNSVFLPGSRTIVTFFGPDVDATRTGSFEANRGRTTPLETTVSQVVRSSDLTDLPLAGRDAYTVLVLQAGVSSDGATTRGLGLAANGQRPTASNFLLDGLENNNYLTAGPLVPVAPQAIQEYRVSTNNYSAEYGRTSGFLTNAITRSGVNQFHGTAYLYMKNEILNANGFQENAAGIKRADLKEMQPGIWIGGPIVSNKLFFSSNYEFLRHRTRQAAKVFTVPNLPVFLATAPANSQSGALLRLYAPPTVGGPGLTGQITLEPPVSADRHVIIERLDYNPGANDRITGSLVASRLTRPDFIWSPYPDFISALYQTSWRASASHIHTFSPGLLNEFRGAYGDDNLSWNRPHSEVGALVSLDGVTLPGSSAFFAFKNRNRNWEFLDNVGWSLGRNRLTLGGGALLRTSDGFQTAGRDPLYAFSNIANFATDQLAGIRVAVRGSTAPAPQQPDSTREYRYQQYFGFVQDTVRVTQRLTVNAGVRYELFGSPSNSGAVKDRLVVLGAGTTLAQQLTTAQFASGNAGDQQLFGADNTNWSVRAGASYDLFGSGRTLLRASYGLFFDRPFDNLWQSTRNNDSVVQQIIVTDVENRKGVPYTGPVENILSQFQSQLTTSTPSTVTLIDPNLRNGRVHSYFAGVQQRITRRMTAEINALGSYGRNLVTTDIVNRIFSTSTGLRFNQALPDVSYRTGAGASDYNGLSGVLRYQGNRSSLQVTYTWSQVSDNQSEPLTGEFLPLTFSVNPTAGIPGSGANGQLGVATFGRAALSRQFDLDADRGNSDFDQRHNLTVFYTYHVPGSMILVRNWLIAGIAAFRSGFPLTVISPSLSAIPGQGVILNNRPDLVPGVDVFAPPDGNGRSSILGGTQFLNQAAFQASSNGSLGNLGRGAFAGPGFYSVDLSLARSFAVGWLGDAGRLQFRADAFNVLNHTNLGNPNTVIGTPNFGVARYGRIGRSDGFPPLTPLAESARQLQMSVQLSF